VKLRAQTSARATKTNVTLTPNKKPAAPKMADDMPHSWQYEANTAIQRLMTTIF